MLNGIRYRGSVAFHPNGDSVAYLADRDRGFALWQHPLDGGVPHKITDLGAWSVSDFQCAPSGDFLLLADQNGGEQFSLWKIAPGQNEAEFLAPFPGERCFQGRLSDDGRSLVYSAVHGAENNRTRLALLDLDTWEETHLWEHEGVMAFGELSPDQRWLPVLLSTEEVKAQLLLIDVRTGEARPADWTQRGVDLQLGPWRKDGRALYLLSNEEREFRALYLWQLDQATPSIVEAPPWDVQDVWMDVPGQRLLWTVNENGCDRLYGRSLPDGSVVQWDFDIEGIISTLAVSPLGGKVIARVSTFERPSELMIIDLEPDLSAWSLMPTDSQPDVAVRIEQPVILRPDGTHVPAFLYSPSTRPVGSSLPVMISVHGGPHDQERPSYHPFHYALVQQGIAVLAPNITGSTGYGRSYEKAIHGDWGGQDLQDIEICLQYLKEQNWTDKDRIAIGGISYGGFVALSALTRIDFPWACGLSFLGVTDLRAFVENMPAVTRPMLHHLIGDPQQDADRLLSRSPSTHSHRLQAPLMIIQGANDARVRAADTQRFVETLTERGIAVEYLLFENAGHGISNTEDLELTFQRIIAFLLHHLPVRA